MLHGYGDRVAAAFGFSESNIAFSFTKGCVRVSVV